MKKILSICVAIFLAFSVGTQVSAYDGTTSKKPKTTSTTKSQTWMQGQWRYVSQYGTVNIYITGNTMKVYFDSQCAYSGSYSYRKGSEFSDGWERLVYPDGWIYVNSSTKKLYYDKGEPMTKVK